MARIAKNPEERKTELMDAAQQLFLEKGYEKTAVSDIVKHIHVAQGTFYYHFKSKSEILDAVIDRFISWIETELKQITDNRQLDAARRLNAAINKLFEITGSTREIIDYLHQESNALLHERIVSITMERLVPLFADIADDGRQSGQFTIRHSEETAEVILSALFWQIHQPGLHENPDKLYRVRQTLELMLDRMLGVADQTFQLNIN